MRALSAATLLTSAFILASAAPAAAGMGSGPAAPGIYVSLGGGYVLQSGDGIIGYGIEQPGGGIVDVTVDPGNGYFIEGAIGYAETEPLFSGLPFTRWEIYALYGSSDDSVSDTAPPRSGIALKNDSATVLVTGGSSGITTSERETFETGISFEGDTTQSGGTSLTFVLTPFVRWMGEDTTTIVTECCTLRRDAEVDTWMYGILAALEPEAALGSQVSIVGRIGAGLYGYQSDGTFNSSADIPPAQSVFGAHVSDSDSGIGFRGVLGVGLKITLAPGALLETFAQADYFTNTGLSQLSNNQPGDTTASHTGSSDLWEFRSGARVTVSLGQ